jgi:hypothetical protein
MQCVPLNSPVVFLNPEAYASHGDDSETYGVYAIEDQQIDNITTTTSTQLTLTFSGGVL